MPALGHLELARVSPSAVRAWYMDLRRRFVTTGDDAYRMLRAMPNTAVSDGLIARNPCRVRGAGQAKSTERPVATLAELEAAVAAVPEHRRLLLLLPAWCQLRRGEVLALQRRDLDLLHATIRIERSLVRPMSGGIVLGPPKSQAGHRTFAIPSNVLPELRAHLDAHVGPEPGSWLFTNDHGGPMDFVTLDRVWRRARVAIGRNDLLYHDLRHTGLTWAAASGASLAELMRRGGHAHPAAALRYQHATDDRDRVIAGALAALASGDVTGISDRSARVNARVNANQRDDIAHAAPTGSDSGSSDRENTV